MPARSRRVVVSEPVKLARGFIHEQVDALSALAELVGPSFQSAVSLFLKTSDFTAHGGFGFGKTKDRSEASPEKGEKILRATTDLIEGLIEELKSLQVS